MKNKHIINMLRTIKGESLAHQRARVKRQLRYDNQANLNGNWLVQGKNRFDGGLTQ